METQHVIARRLAAFLVLACLLTACGGTTTTPRGPGIEDVRRRARERPDDPAAQAALAEAELLMPGGDSAERAALAIARARELDPASVRLAFVHAIERGAHGHMSDALDAHLEVITLARRSADPIAPVLAEISASALEELDDGVPRFGPRVRESLEPVFASAGAEGPATRVTVGEILLDQAYRRGDLDGVRSVRDALGCPSEWRVIGPFGPRQLLGFDGAYAPETGSALAATYDLGPGRGSRPTRTVEARGCAVHLGNGPVTGPGSTYSETTLRAPADGEYLLRVESPNTVEAWLDGRSIARLDRRREPLPRLAYVPVQLSAGEHRLLVETASRHPNPVLIVSLLRAAPGSAEVAWEGETRLDSLARVMRAMARADFVSAREAMHESAREDDATAIVLAIATAIALSDPLTGSRIGQDEARRMLPAAVERDARAWYPRFQLARLEGDDLDAIGALQSASEAWPEVLILPLTLLDTYEQRGWGSHVEETIRVARAMVPDACRPIRAEHNAALRRARHEEVLRLARMLTECDAQSQAVLAELVRQRRWDEAAAELARLASLEPRTSRQAILDHELDLARARDDGAEVTRILRALGELAARASAVVTLEADRLLASGDAQGARERIASALRAEPESMGELRRTLRALGGESPLEAHRVDGLAAIREFEASGRSYDQPKVLVLDYTVTRVFEDGSTLELTHQITRIQSEEAVDEEGEFSPPEDAQLLTLRTIKADGRRLEPDEIQGKDTISMPSLAVGDYVEQEYLRASPPPAGYPGGVVGNRFYFQSFEVPFDRSELTLIMPSRMEAMIDPRGRAPTTEQRVEGGLRIYHWLVRESRPLAPEPGAVAAREYLPSIDWGVGATWDAYVESMLDVLVDREIRDPAHERLVREIVGTEASTPEARARRIHAWVLENVEESEDFFAQAATMVHSRTGNRSRVLAYLFSLAGIEAELVLARSYAGDMTESTLPDDDTYRFLVTRVTGSTGDHWVWAGARGAAFDFLPLDPLIRGQDALVLRRGPLAHVRVGDPPSASDRKTIDVDVHLEADGSAHLVVTETYRGAGAVGWRSQLEEVPAAQLETLFDQRYVALQMPGARMTDLRITGREDPEQPIVLRYEFDVAEVGREDRGARVIPGLFTARLAPALARAARRTTTQVLPGGVDFEATVRFHLPSGASVETLPPVREMSGQHGARASYAATQAGDVITIQRSVVVPRMRITPEEYEQHAAFCRTVDEADEAELRLTL